MDIYDSDLIMIQVASLHYESDKKYLDSLLSKIMQIVHADNNDYSFSDYENLMGWNFYTLAISRRILQRFLEICGGEIVRLKGSSIDQKFIRWLEKKTDCLERDIRLDLVADLKSSRFGLF